MTDDAIMRFHVVRGLSAATVLAVGSALLPAVPVAAGESSAVESHPVPDDGVFRMVGSGWGHGRGRLPHRDLGGLVEVEPVPAERIEPAGESQEQQGSPQAGPAAGIEPGTRGGRVRERGRVEHRVERVDEGAGRGQARVAVAGQPR